MQFVFLVRCDGAFEQTLCASRVVFEHGQPCEQVIAPSLGEWDVTLRKFLTPSHEVLLLFARYAATLLGLRECESAECELRILSNGLDVLAEHGAFKTLECFEVGRDGTCVLFVKRNVCFATRDKEVIELLIVCGGRTNCVNAVDHRPCCCGGVI